ncbi:MAG: hypothetical protein AABX93_01785 [Nanoarchaeota archaeon]
MVDYASQFDELVDKLNEYLADSKSKKRNWRAFFHGMGSALNLFGNGFSYYGNHPVYSRKDLSPGQIDAVVLASDSKRIIKNLDEFEQTPVLRDVIKKFHENLYNDQRTVYINNAKQRN